MRRKKSAKRVRTAIDELNLAFVEAADLGLYVELCSYGGSEWSVFAYDCREEYVDFSTIESITYQPEQPPLPDKKTY